MQLETYKNNFATPANNIKTPFLVWMVLIFTALAFYGYGSILGFNLSGIGWTVPLAFSLLILSRNFSAVSFPYLLWLPWTLLLVTYLVVTDYSKLDIRVIPMQRTVQLLCPIFVGMAASTYRLSPVLLRQVTSNFRFYCTFLILLTLYQLRSFLFAEFLDYSGMAAAVMTVMLFCSFFANRYMIFKEKRDLIIWCLLLLVPMINLTRTAILATLLTFPLGFGPMKMSRRILAILLLVVVALGVFHMPRVQKKMFYSGRGELSDVMSEDFATSGRSFMWEKMLVFAGDESWVGRGTGAAETFVYGITGGIAYPHNDWLLTYFDYGFLGVIVFLCCIVLTIDHSLRCARQCDNQEIRLLFIVGASAFIPFMIMMITDNVMIYTSFFGNLHFTLLGLAYGALKFQREDSHWLQMNAVHPVTLQGVQ